MRNFFCTAQTALVIIIIRYRTIDYIISCVLNNDDNIMTMCVYYILLYNIHCRIRRSDEKQIEQS